MLSTAVNIVKENSIDCVFIVGDIYDKQVPPAEAITVFDRFISQLANINIPLLSCLPFRRPS